MNPQDEAADVIPPKPLGRWLRAFFRQPIYIYDCGFPGYERLFGQHWLLLTTKGRKTGKSHRVMLDLVGHDTEKKRYYIQPGWGRQSDWVKNIEGNPEVEAQVGKESFRARITEVSGSEGAEWLYRFRRQHPIQSWFVSKFMLGIRPPATQDETVIRAWLAKNFIVFALDRSD